MNNFEKNETLRQLRKMHEKFGQEIAVERKNGALLRYGEIILDIIKTSRKYPQRKIVTNAKIANVSK